MAGTKQKLVWQGASAGAVAISVVVTRRLLNIAWRQLRGDPPPDDPTDRKVSFGAALVWAVSMGVGLAVARLVALRLSARAWEAATHEEPPD